MLPSKGMEGELSSSGQLLMTGSRDKAPPRAKIASRLTALSLTMMRAFARIHEVLRYKQSLQTIRIRGFERKLEP